MTLESGVFVTLHASADEAPHERRRRHMGIASFVGAFIAWFLKMSGGQIVARPEKERKSRVLKKPGFGGAKKSNK